jgi:hypothetical protein
MKSIVNRVMVFCLLATLAGTTAFAKVRKASVTLAADTKVNGTLVKQGMYDLVFDEQSGELSIFKGTKLIVKTATRLEQRDRKARHNEVQTALEGMEQKLVSITFDGSDQNVVVTQMGMQAGGN